MTPTREEHAYPLTAARANPLLVDSEAARPWYYLRQHGWFALSVSLVLHVVLLTVVGLLMMLDRKTQQPGLVQVEGVTLIMGGDAAGQEGSAAEEPSAQDFGSDERQRLEPESTEPEEEIPEAADVQQEESEAPETASIELPAFDPEKARKALAKLRQAQPIGTGSAEPGGSNSGGRTDGAGTSGSGQGPNRGPGADSRDERGGRWIISFQNLTSDQYKKLIRAMGGELAIVTSDSTDVLYFFPKKKRKGSITSDGRIAWYPLDRGNSRLELAVANAQGVTVPNDGIIVLFLGLDTENTLSRVEREAAQRRSISVENIQRTVFVPELRGTKVSWYVSEMITE